MQLPKGFGTYCENVRLWQHEEVGYGAFARHQMATSQTFLKRVYFFGSTGAHGQPSRGFDPGSSVP
jgi:hypothetical protein